MRGIGAYRAWRWVCDGCVRVGNSIVAAQQIARQPVAHPRRQRHYGTQWRLASDVVWHDLVLSRTPEDTWYIAYITSALRSDGLLTVDQSLKTYFEPR